MTAHPRLFGIPAVDAPVVAIIRRGPSDWVHIGRWDVATDAFSPGAWMRGTIYPQKCDLSPDGRWLVYSAMKPGADWPAGSVYEAVSRLPWLQALAAWGSGSTYTRGLHFSPERADPGPPDVGVATAVVDRYGLVWTEPIQFAVERRRGWRESSTTASRPEGGPWDEGRRVAMVKPQPGGPWQLRVEGRYAAFRSGEPTDGPPVYSISSGDRLQTLDDVQWADWDPTGALLVATTTGVLQRLEPPSGPVVEIADLGRVPPDPRPAPAWASEF
jgi:hypothetical protein